MVQVIEKVDEQEAAGSIAALVEDLPPEKLLEEEPEPGEVVAVEELVELGAKELKLSNGMVVVFRHSDMQEDQILLSVCPSFLEPSLVIYIEQTILRVASSQLHFITAPKII